MVLARPGAALPLVVPVLVLLVRVPVVVGVVGPVAVVVGRVGPVGGCLTGSRAPVM